MKKTNLIKVVSILLISLMLISIGSSVFAANTTSNENDFADLTASLNSTNSSNTANNTSRNNTSANTDTNTNIVSSSSNYNNTSNLPSIGLESSIPAAALVIIFAISAIYAYRKIKYYHNI